ncbi:hypothetical protein F4677DRAFT_466028 [Hypoxylon crocopeplum]|nr:hypothetical protein F4677DRAFT_466028 [Hypoxylon crocopeplum]
MAETTSSNECVTIRDLPIEVLQEIWTNPETPRELLDFKRVCKRFDLAIGKFELYKVDAAYQIAYDEYVKEELVCPWVCYPRQASSPSLQWMIHNRADIEDIKQCILAYLKIYPAFLELGGISLRENAIRCEPPMCSAAITGRLDVVKTLIEIGVPIRPPRPEYNKLEYLNDDQAAILRVSTREEEGIAKINPMYHACRMANDDIAFLMIQNGLETRIDDLYNAAIHNRLRIVEALLQHLTLVSDKLPSMALIVLEKFIRESAELPDVYPLLIAAAACPSFDKVLWLENKITRSIDQARDLRRRAFRNYGIPSSQYALFFLKIFISLDEVKRTPDVAFSIAREAAKSEVTLEIIKTILDNFPSSESDRQRLISELLMIAVENWNCPTVRYLHDLGCPLTSYHLRLAIGQGLPEFKVDMIYLINSKAPNALEEMGDDGEKPLHYALKNYHFDVAFILIGLGADLTNVPYYIKNRLFEYCILHNYDFLKDWRGTKRPPSRKILSSRKCGYIEKLHAMYGLILGLGYLENIDIRLGYLSVL